MAKTATPPPPLYKLLLEARAPWEFASLYLSRRWLDRIPKGDGHPVLVFPGMMATDISTYPMRQQIRRFGYSAYAWQSGRNVGPQLGTIRRLIDRVERLYSRHKEPVSLVGWSLGGLYAREIAKVVPEHVRCVITLGSPVNGDARGTNVWRIFKHLNGELPDEKIRKRIHTPPPVPTVSIYSRSDGVVGWQSALNPNHAHCENIEVFASHLGIGFNPLAMAALADRLAQRPERWEKFNAEKLRRTLWGDEETEQSEQELSVRTR
jgi:pimeloyl-ACP methyl ester carboxylesterase